MKKVKGFLRKHLVDLIFVLGFIISVINFLYGTKTFFKSLVLFLYCIDSILIYGRLLIIKITKKVLAHNILKTYTEGFNALKRAHKIRYKLYFKGTREEVEETSKLIEELAKCLISYEENEGMKELLNHKQLEYIGSCKEIINQMLTTENPNMIKGL